MNDRDMLKLVIVGHVDHGKSTLIGRLLCDTGSLPDGKMEELRAAADAAGKPVEIAHVMDHLQEEREREMTIDTTQAFFRTARRDYVIIDAPGHRELLHNMISGAAQAEAAVLVVDAAEGVKDQTRRHATFLTLLGIGQAVILVNKMDKAGHDCARFEALAREIGAALSAVGISARACVPGSALTGGNIVRRSQEMAWYTGPTVLDALEDVPCAAARTDGPLRLPVQDVRFLDRRCIPVGRVESGRIAAGMEVVLLPSGARATVATIEVFGQARSSALRGECIGFTIRGSKAPERGEVCSCPVDQPAVVQRFRAKVFWMSEEPCLVGEGLVLRVATQALPCCVERIERRYDSATWEVIEEGATRLNVTEIGSVIVAAGRPAVVEPYARMPELGRVTLARGPRTVAGGQVVEAYAPPCARDAAAQKTHRRQPWSA